MSFFEFSSLPHYDEIVRADNEAVLGVALTEALGGSWIEYIAPVKGAQFSVRMFSKDPFPGSTGLPRPFTGLGMAWELLRLGEDEARYPIQVDPNKKKGWAISKLEWNGRPLAIAMAVWV